MNALNVVNCDENDFGGLHVVIELVYYSLLNMLFTDGWLLRITMYKWFYKDYDYVVGMLIVMRHILLLNMQFEKE